MFKKIQIGMSESEVIRLMAFSLLYRGKKDLEWMTERMPKGSLALWDNYLLRIYAKKKALELILSGNLEWSHGIWNPDFVQGLRFSGVFYKHYIPTKHFILDTGRELYDEIKGMGLFIKEFPREGRKCLGVRCPVLALRGKDPMSFSTLAGLFSGARNAKRRGVEWLKVSKNEGSEATLNAWTIPYEEGCKGLIISPFYGWLVEHGMSPAAKARLRRIEVPGGDVETRAMVYWEMYFSEKYGRSAWWAGELPYGIGQAAFKRRHINRKDLHRVGLGLGINRVDGKLEGLLRRYREEFMEGKKVVDIGGGI